MIKKVAIIGGGVIGGGWAARFLLNGLDVYIYDPDPNAEKTLLEVINNARFALPMLYESKLPKEGKIKFCKSIEEALSHCKNDSQPFIIGGGEIYTQTIDIADKIELTRVYKNYDGDAYFPEIPKEKFNLIKEETNEINGDEKIKYSFLTYKRK